MVSKLNLKNINLFLIKFLIKHINPKKVRIFIIYSTLFEQIFVSYMIALSTYIPNEDQKYPVCLK